MLYSYYSHTDGILELTFMFIVTMNMCIHIHMIKSYVRFICVLVMLSFVMLISHSDQITFRSHSYVMLTVRSHSFVMLISIWYIQMAHVVNPVTRFPFPCAW
jgi:hypothetical protein